MMATERKHLSSADQYQSDWKTPFLQIPDEVTQIILELALRNPNPSTLTLVCKNWSVLLTDICKRLIKKLWPHLVSNKEKNWTTVYLQKTHIQENIMAGRYTGSIIRTNGTDEQIFPLNQRSIAIFRQLANPQASPTSDSPNYIKQVDVWFLGTACTERVIEIINAFTIQNSILYMDIGDFIHAFDIHTHEPLGVFSGYQGGVVHLHVDENNTLLALTAKCENAIPRTNTHKEFYLYSWNLETKRKHLHVLGLANSCRFLATDDKTIWIEHSVKHEKTYIQLNKDNLQMIHKLNKFHPHQIIRHQDLTLVSDGQCWKITKNKEPFATEVSKEKTCEIIEVFIEEDRLIIIAHYKGYTTANFLIQIWDIKTNQKINGVETQFKEFERERFFGNAMNRFAIHKISENHLLFMIKSEYYEGSIALVNLYTGEIIYKNKFPFARHYCPVVYCGGFDEKPIVFPVTKSLSLCHRTTSIAVIDFSKDGEKEPRPLASINSHEAKFISPRQPQKPANPKHRCLIS